MAAEPSFDLPLWNEQSKGRLQGQLRKSSRSGFTRRYKMQHTLFVGDLTDAANLAKFRATAVGAMKPYLGMIRTTVNMTYKTLHEVVVIDANAYIGARECSLRAGYSYDNGALKILISRPKKKLDGEGALPGIVLASPIGVDAAPVEDWDFNGRAMAGAYRAVVCNVGYRAAGPEDPMPAGMLDMLAGLKYMIARADELGIDKSRIAIACQSAGAHVACPLPLELAARGEAHLVKLVVMASPGPTPFGSALLGPYDAMPPWVAHCTRTVCLEQYKVIAGPKWQELYESKDPLLHCHHAPRELLAKLPPHILFSAEFDDFRSIHEEYAKKLHDAGALRDFLILPGGCHDDTQLAPLLNKSQWNLATVKKHL